jgi:hypothetical protein
LYIFVALYAVLCSVLIFGVLGFAMGDYMDTLGLYQTNNPVSCIMSPDPELEPMFYPYMYDITRSAIWEWEIKLNSQTNGDWKFPIYEYPFHTHDKKTPNEFPECDIFITFDQLSGDSALGTTGFDFSKSSHKYAFITVYTQAYPPQKITISIGNDSSISMELVPKQLDLIDIRNIVSHEFGHGLGLGHYYLHDPSCVIQNCQERSIMYHSLDIWKNMTKTVQDEDIQMLVKIYGEDGFGYPRPHWIPQQCDYVEGLIGDCR